MACRSRRQDWRDWMGRHRRAVRPWYRETRFWCVALLEIARVRLVRPARWRCKGRASAHRDGRSWRFPNISCWTQLNRICFSRKRSAQHAVEQRKADQGRKRDQRVTDRAEQGFARLAEQPGAEQDSDRIGGADHKREFERTGCDEAGQRIARSRKNIRCREERQDVGAGDERKNRTAEPVGHDRRSAGLREPAAKSE